MYVLDGVWVLSSILKLIGIELGYVQRFWPGSCSTSGLQQKMNLIVD